MQRKKILLVVKDESTKEILESSLKFEYDCISVSSCEEGIGYLEANLGEVSLIILDVVTPEEDEFKILQCIRANPKYRNILVLVAVTLERARDITCAFDEGVDDIITKPINPDILQRRVHNMFSIADNTLVHNVMEDLIRTEIDENIVNLGICPCPICRKDLLTLTLNNVKPKYVSTEKGEIITRAGSLASWEGRMKLLAEVTHYASLIKEKPRHE